MRLSERHVALLARQIEDAGPLPGFVATTEEQYQQTIDAFLSELPASGELWIFAYGSLIWKPACDVVELKTGVVRGWHRAFCLGWNTRFRGSDEHPGLMLALDRGGACKGVAYRLPPSALAENLDKLLRREMGFWPSPFPPRWVNVETSTGIIRAITFAMDRKSERYVTGLSNERIAQVLAEAVGARGSMAEYLYATVKHLEDLGIHDRHLWELQEMVAERIEAAYPAEGDALAFGS
jgi:cation transport protein ChaC